MAITVKQPGAQRFYGLSTDTKPTPPVGSTFYAVDTGKAYVFVGSWVEVDTLALFLIM